jgi:cysteine synthase
VRVFVPELNSIIVPGTNTSYSVKVDQLKNKIGNTPFVHLTTVNNNKIFAKLEYKNIFSQSVKDRTAAYMMTGPIERGEINPVDDKVWIEASSGNLGIAYGKIGSYLGLKTFIVMPSIVGNVTINRVRESADRYEITEDGYCPRGERDGALKRLYDIWSENPSGYIFRDQYSSSDNLQAHRETTGPEFWNQSGGKITHLVLAPGTGGTIIGSAQFLKHANPKIQIIAIEPQKDHHIHGVRNYGESMKPILFKDNEDLIDSWVSVNDQEAFESTTYLWKMGCKVGSSSGLNFAGAKKIAESNKKAYVATLFPDSSRNTNEIVTQFINQQGMRTPLNKNSKPLPSSVSYPIENNGPRLDIALVETEKLLLHEETISKNLDTLLDDVKSVGIQKTPVIVDRDSLVVLDGMHRVKVLKHLDCRFTCVYLIDYMSPDIKVDRWCRVVSPKIDIDEFSSRFGRLRIVAGNGSIPHEGQNLLLMLEDGTYELAASEQGILSSFNNVASIEAWLREISLKIRYKSEMEAVGMLERREIGFVLCPPAIKKQHIIETAKSGLLLIPKATRHIVPTRPLGVNVPLNLLREENISIEKANHRLSEMLKGKTLRRFSPGTKGRHHQYDESFYKFE